MQPIAPLKLRQLFTDNDYSCTDHVLKGLNGVWVDEKKNSYHLLKGKDLQFVIYKKGVWN